MILSHWPDKSYPCLFNPDDKEVLYFADKERWDTLRICIVDDHIGIGSGHGHTHTSVQQLMAKRLKKRILPETWILFREDGDFWFNCEDTSGKRKVHWRKVLKEFSERHQEIITTLVEEYK